MEKTINKVVEEFNAQVILFYSPDEKNFIKNLHKQLNSKNIFANIETKSIRELAALISNCDMFFGNEGGPRHIAQSLDIPSFAIFSPKSSKKEWLGIFNEKHQGVEPKDIYPDCSSLSYKDSYLLIQPDYILSKIKEIYSQFIENKEEEKMKNLLFILIIGMYSLTFTSDKYDILEDRIENNLEYNFRSLDDGKKKLKVKEYDVDIFEDYVNLKAEINSTVKNFDFDKAFIPIREEIKNEMKSNPEINIIVELEKVLGEDKIIYNKTL